MTTTRVKMTTKMGSMETTTAMTKKSAAKPKMKRIPADGPSKMTISEVVACCWKMMTELDAACPKKKNSQNPHQN